MARTPVLSDYAPSSLEAIVWVTGSDLLDFVLSQEFLDEASAFLPPGVCVPEHLVGAMALWVHRRASGAALPELEKRLPDAPARIAAALSAFAQRQLPAVRLEYQALERASQDEFDPEAAMLEQWIWRAGRVCGTDIAENSARELLEAVRSESSRRWAALAAAVRKAPQGFVQ